MGKREWSDWMVADCDSPIEINLDNGARVLVYARPCGVVQCELRACIQEPDTESSQDNG